MPHLYLVRPGQTDANTSEQERVRSWKDYPLNESGLKEAHDVAGKLENKQVAAVYHDGSSRSKHTAQIIGEHTNAPVHQLPGLKDWNVGKFAGQPMEQVAPQLKYYQKHPDVKVPGGESFNEFYDRYKDTLSSLAQVVNSSPHDHIAVTHGNNFASTPSILSDGEAPVDSKHIPKNGHIWPIRISKGRYAIEPPNSTEPEEQ